MEETKESNVSVDKSQINETKSTKNTKLTKPTIFSLIVLVVLLLAGVTTAAYTQIVLNNPDRIWQDAVQNTKSGLDEVNTILSESNLTGGSINGSLSVESPLVASATLEGEWSNNDAKITSETKIAGVTLNSDIWMVGNQDNNNSDLYIKIDGLDSLSIFSELLAPGSSSLLNQVNNNWYKIQSNEPDDVAALPEGFDVEKITENNYMQEVERFSSLLEEYIFSEETSQNAISYELIGREDFNGNDSYKYKININKERSQELLNEINGLVEESSILSSDNSKDLEESLNIEEFIDDISSNNLEVFVWVDMELRYFRNTRIYIPQEIELISSYVDVGLDYEGGDEMPFYINTVLTSEEENNTTSLLLSATLNKTSLATQLEFILSVTSDQQPINASGKINIIPGETSIDVEAPEDYESFDSLIENTDILSLFNPNSSQDFTNDTPFILDDVEL